MHISLINTNDLKQYICYKCTLTTERNHCEAPLTLLEASNKLAVINVKAKRDK